MSAADLSLVGAAAYTARTKRARLRVHREEKRRRRRGRAGFIGRTQLAGETIRWTDDAPRVFTSFTREGSREKRERAWLPHAPGKVPRFEQVDNLYRCRDTKTAKEKVVLRVLAWIASFPPLLPSFENIYIFLRYRSQDLYGDIRRDGTHRNWESFRCSSIPIRTKLNQPLKSFN